MAITWRIWCCSFAVREYKEGKGGKKYGDKGKEGRRKGKGEGR